MAGNEQITASGQHDLLPMVLTQIQAFSNELGGHRKAIEILEKQMGQATAAIREAANEIRNVGSKLSGFVTKPECEEIREKRDEDRAEQRASAIGAVVEDVDKIGSKMRELKREVCPTPEERRQRLGLWIGVIGGIVGLAAAAIGVLFWLQSMQTPAEMAPLRLHPDSIKQLGEEVLRRSKTSELYMPGNGEALTLRTMPMADVHP